MGDTICKGMFVYPCSLFRVFSCGCMADTGVVPTLVTRCHGQVSAHGKSTWQDLRRARSPVLCLGCSSSNSWLHFPLPLGSVGCTLQVCPSRQNVLSSPADLSCTTLFQAVGFWCPWLRWGRVLIPRISFVSKSFIIVAGPLNTTCIRRVNVWVF